MTTEEANANLEGVKNAKKGSVIQWLNLFKIWQSGILEIPYNPNEFGHFVAVRRFPPEDSEDLPNDELIFLFLHDHPGNVRVKP